MALTHVSKQFAVKDAKIAKVLTDPSGGSATYATSIDVPGIKTVGVGGDVNNQQLRGDNQLLDTDTVLGNVTLSVEHAKVSLDALAVMMGLTVTDSGTTPNQIATAALAGNNSPNYFKLEAASATADPVAGDLHYVFYKCKISSLPSLGLAEEDYATVSFDCICVPRLADNKWMDIVLNETAVAIP